jgi:WD40 repeat protein
MTSEMELHAFLDAHDQYLRDRTRHRARFDIRVEEIITTPEIIRTPEKAVITLCQRGTKLFLGTEGGDYSVIDTATLREDMCINFSRVDNSSNQAIWHAMFQDDNTVIFTHSFLNLCDCKTNEFTVLCEQNANSFGRKNLHVYNGFILFAASDNVLLVDTKKRELIDSIKLAVHRREIPTIEPIDNYRLASGGEGGEVIIWDLKKQVEIQRLDVESAWAMMYYKNDILLTGSEKIIQKWNIATGECLCYYHAESTIRGFTYLSDSLFLTCCDNGHMFVTSVSTLEPVLTLDSFHYDTVGTGRNDILGAELLDDGRLVTTSRHNSMYIWKFAVTIPSRVFKRLATCCAFYDVQIKFT